MTDASPPTCEWLTKIDPKLRLLLGHTTFLPFDVLNLLYTNNNQGHSYSAEQNTHIRKRNLKTSLYSCLIKVKVPWPLQTQQRFQSACGQVLQIYNCLIDHFMAPTNTHNSAAALRSLLLKSFKISQARL